MKTFVNQDVYLTEFNLHKKYAVSEAILDLVWTHSNIIADVAIHLHQKNNLDLSIYNLGVVVQAALMHDIGVYACDGYEWLIDQPPFNRPYIQHSLVGSIMLQQEGFSLEVATCALVHSGVGLTTPDIKKFGLQLPEGNYVPTTPIQRLISYSTKFHSKAPAFKSVEEIRAALGKYGKEKQRVFDDLVREYGTPDLDPIKLKYADWQNAFVARSNQMTMVGLSLNSAGIAL